MDALILDSDYGLQMAVARALTGRGCTVICVDSIRAAEAFVRLSPPDLLVMAERIGGRLTHPVALLAECQNPDIAAILLSDRADSDVGEVFDLLPAVRAVMGRDVDPDTIGQMMLCVTGTGRPVRMATVAPPPRPSMVAPEQAVDWPEAEDESADLLPAEDSQPQWDIPAMTAPVTAPEPVHAVPVDTLAPTASEPVAPASEDQTRWRAALELVTGGRIDDSPKAPAPVGAPRAAWWEDWDEGTTALPPQRAVAGGRRMTLG
jgi:hypothetical protein